MQKISSYLYPNRIQLLADVAGFSTEYTNVYQRIIKIYQGVDNVLEFDIKNADQKRIDASTLENITLNLMDSQGNNVGQYEITPFPQDGLKKGLAQTTVPFSDLQDLTPQFLRYSVTYDTETTTQLLYGDTRFGATGTIELLGSVMARTRPPQVLTSFAAEIDLKGHPTWHSSAIPVRFYEAVPTTAVGIELELLGLVGSVWVEGTKRTTINTEAFKGADYLWSATYTTSAPGNGTVTVPTITIGEYQYLRVSYTSPLSNGVGASFTVIKENEEYNVEVKFGGTGYSVGSQMKILGSVLGGVDGVNDLIISVTGVEGNGSQNTASYFMSSITTISWTGTASEGTATYITTGTNITGKVDKVTVG